MSEAQTPELLPTSQVPAAITPPPKHWTVLGAFWMFLGMLAAQVVLTIPVGIALGVAHYAGADQLAQDWQLPLILLSTTLATLLLLIWQRRREGAKPLWDKADLRDGRAWGMAALALLLCVGVNVLRILLEPNPQVPALNQRMLDLVSHAGQTPWVPLALSFIGMVILAPVTEEWLFRGIIQPALGAKWGQWVALPVTALVFGALHLEGWWVAAIYGLAIGLIANRVRSLALPMIVHCTINLTVFVLVLTSAH